MKYVRIRRAHRQKRKLVGVLSIDNVLCSELDILTHLISITSMMHLLTNIYQVFTTQQALCLEQDGQEP